MRSFTERSTEINATSIGSAHRLSDESMVEAAKGGHSTAFATLSERYRQQLFRAAHRITRSCEDAEDAVQGALLRAFVHLRDFDGRSSFSTWLTRIAINSALMRLRKNRASREIPMDESAGSGDTLSRFEPADWRPDPEEHYAQRERQSIVAGAVHGLRPAIRTVVEIRELQECSIKETAQRLGLSVAAAKGRLFHGRAALRKALRLKTIGRARMRCAA